LTTASAGTPFVATYAAICFTFASSAASPAPILAARPNSSERSSVSTLMPLRSSSFSL